MSSSTTPPEEREGLRFSPWNLLLLLPFLMLVTPWFNSWNRACSGCPSSTGCSSCGSSVGVGRVGVVYVKTRDETNPQAPGEDVDVDELDEGTRRCNWVELVVFVVLFLAVTVMGFLAARWRRGDDLDHLDEWGLGGRSFGSLDHLVPASAVTSTPRTRSSPCPRCCSAPARSGFFAVPYTVHRLPAGVPAGAAAVVGLAPCTASSRPADFVRGRFGSPDAGAARRDHRHRRDDALHRAAARRHRGGAPHDGPQRRAACSGTSR